MDDADDAWSAEPDENFRTPKADAGNFDNTLTLTTPTTNNGNDLEEEATPQQPKSPVEDRDSDRVAHLAKSLPRLNLESAIDSDRNNGRNAQQEQRIGNNGHNISPTWTEEEPETARPSFASRASSYSQVSPDLHTLASLYKPDETQLTVADSAGYFESVNLSTPTFEHFSNGLNGGGGTEWSENYRSQSKGKSREGNGGGFSWGVVAPRDAENEDGDGDVRRKSKSNAGRQSSGTTTSSGRGFGHRKTASDASATSLGALRNSTSSRRASWIAAHSSASASTPSFTHEPESYNPEAELEDYNPRASSSSSSVADSIGTAGEAPDSDYEDQRSKSHSRQGSRRPSVSERPQTLGKRLSSFAPLPSLKATPSQTDLSVNQQDSISPRNSASISRPERKDTDSKIRAEEVSRSSSAQSASSSASGSSANTGNDGIGGASSAPTSRTASANTYSLPMTATNSQSFDQHRKENEKWISKSRKSKPSTLDKVMSKTRPRDLPPKERQEDKKHMKEYEEMLLASRLAAKKKAAVRSAKHHAREIAATQALPIWEKEILPNWKSVLRKDNLRQIWWSGTMPPRYRSRFWQSCIGNSLVLGKTSYAKALALARSLESSGKFPPEIVEAIKADVAHILPQTKLFQEGCPLHTDIIELLQAHCVFWKNDKPVYRSGTCNLAGMLLVCMPAQEAFLCLVNIINKSLLKTFYYGSQDDIEAYYRVFNTLLADKMPKVYRNFVSHDIRPSLFLRDWLTTLFTRHLGLESVTRVWDIYVLEGDQFLYRLALALLQILEARLFNPDHEELTELFKGEDKGAKAIVAREQGKPESQVEPWEVYEEMGATEDPIFDTIKEMEWKEATFQRLLMRELPDPDA